MVEATIDERVKVMSAWCSSLRPSLMFSDSVESSGTQTLIDVSDQSQDALHSRLATHSDKIKALRNGRSLFQKFQIPIFTLHWRAKNIHSAHNDIQTPMRHTVICYINIVFIIVMAIRIVLIIIIIIEAGC